jgi:hypothetical protein
MANVTVVFPITFDTINVESLKDIDFKKIADYDHEYIRQVRERIKDAAAHYLEQGSSKPILMTCGEFSQLEDS